MFFSNALNVLCNIQSQKAKTLRGINDALEQGSLYNKKYFVRLELAQLAFIICFLDGDENVNILDINHLVHEINKGRLADIETFNHIEILIERVKVFPSILHKIIETTTKCTTCKVNNSNILMLPCGHILFCFKCFTGKFNCPLCNIKIVQTHVIYI
jgi:hypothetical protein